MFIRKKKLNILNYSIENLSKILEEGNFVELTYILGSKKEIIKRNFLAGIFRGIGIRNRSYYYNCCFSYVITKNSDFKYPNNRRIYF